MKKLATGTAIGWMAAIALTGCKIHLDPETDPTIILQADNGTLTVNDPIESRSTTIAPPRIAATSHVLAEPTAVSKGTLILRDRDGQLSFEIQSQVRSAVGVAHKRVASGVLLRAKREQVDLPVSGPLTSHVVDKGIFVSRPTQALSALVNSPTLVNSRIQPFHGAFALTDGMRSMTYHAGVLTRGFSGKVTVMFFGVDDEVVGRFEGIATTHHQPLVQTRVSGRLWGTTDLGGGWVDAFTGLFSDLANLCNDVNNFAFDLIGKVPRRLESYVGKQAALVKWLRASKKWNDEHPLLDEPLDFRNFGRKIFSSSALEIDLRGGRASIGEYSRWKGSDGHGKATHVYTKVANIGFDAASNVHERTSDFRVLAQGPESIEIEDQFSGSVEFPVVDYNESGDTHKAALIGRGEADISYRISLAIDADRVVLSTIQVTVSASAEVESKTFWRRNSPRLNSEKMYFEGHQPQSHTSLAW